MSESADLVYKALLKDDVFIHQWIAADNDPIPKWFVPNYKKMIYTSIYMGYLVGKHGSVKALIIHNMILGK